MSRPSEAEPWVMLPTVPLTPTTSRPATSSFSREELDTQASQLILNAFSRSKDSTDNSNGYRPQKSRPLGSRHTSAPTPPPPSAYPKSQGALGKSKAAISSVVSGLLRRDGDSNDRGRSRDKDRSAPGSRASSATGTLRARSTSPAGSFFSRSGRGRSPSVGPLRADSSEMGSEFDDSESFAFESGDDSISDNGDDATAENTHINGVPAPLPPIGYESEDDHDPLGEGVNVVLPKPGPFTHIRPKTKHQPLPLITGRPIFNRNRCSIVLVNGDPEPSRAERRPRRYVVASDISDESRFALEWAIGTVLRDGDELYVISAVETDTKIDPVEGAQVDRAMRLKAQQERQTLAYLLARQVTSLIQRTSLHVSITCQAWHAKNARHLLLDVVDFLEPVMLVVGSRGKGKLKGILLGSTSHYLIQKSSVPVMVARRRLKRPPRRSAHLAPHKGARVPLAQAHIDKPAQGGADAVPWGADDAREEAEGERAHGAPEPWDDPDPDALPDGEVPPSPARASSTRSGSTVESPYRGRTRRSDEIANAPDGVKVPG